MKHGKENHYWAQDGAQELRPEHAHLPRYRGTYCFEHNPKGHGMKATLVFPAGTEGFWLIAKFDEQMNYPVGEDPTPAGVWITFSRESFQIDEEPANSLQDEDGGCRGIKGLDHRWVPGTLTGALYCSKCGQPKDMEDVKARFMDRMGLAEAQTEQQAEQNRMAEALGAFVSLAEDRLHELGALSPEMAECLTNGRAALREARAACPAQTEQQPVRVVVDISGGAIHGVYADRPVTIYFKSDDKDDVAQILCDLYESEVDEDMEGEPIASWVHDAELFSDIVDHYHNQIKNPEEPGHG